MIKLFKKIININEIYAIWICVVLIIVFIAAYIYFINVAILYAAERQHLDEKITNLRTSISQLELELIENTRSITEDYAFSLGFSEVPQKVFIERDENTKVSLLNEIHSQ